MRSYRTLRTELNWYYNRIEPEQLRPEERSKERIQQLEQQAREREHDLMRAAQEATAAEMSDAGLQAPSNVPLAEIRAALSTDTVLVEYFCLQNRALPSVLNPYDLPILPLTFH